MTFLSWFLCCRGWVWHKIAIFIGMTTVLIVSETYNSSSLRLHLLSVLKFHGRQTWQVASSKNAILHALIVGNVYIILNSPTNQIKILLWYNRCIIKIISLVIGLQIITLGGIMNVKKVLLTCNENELYGRSSALGDLISERVHHVTCGSLSWVIIWVIMWVLGGWICLLHNP